MRVPATVPLGPYDVHLDVLMARLVRARLRLLRWGLVGVLLLSGLLGYLLGRPFLLGTATIMRPAAWPETVQLTVDDHLVTHAAPAVVLAGTHTVVIRAADHVPITQTMRLTRATTPTLTLPLLRRWPTIQTLQLPTGASTWYWLTPLAGGGGWRSVALRADLAEEDTSRSTPTPLPPLQFWLNEHGMYRDGRREQADVVATLPQAHAPQWAAFTPQPDRGTASVGNLTVAVGTTTRTFTSSVLLTRLWWSPTGERLIGATPTPLGMTLLNLHLQGSTNLRPATITTVPGELVDILFAPDGQRAVVLTTAPPLIGDATLLTWQPDGRVQASALPSPIRLELPLMAWTATGLYWGSNTGGGPQLELRDTTTGQTTALGSLPASVITLLAGANAAGMTTLRAVVAQADGSCALTSWPAQTVLIPLSTIPCTDGVVGGSQDTTVALRNTTTIWTISFDEATLWEGGD